MADATVVRLHAATTKVHKQDACFWNCSRAIIAPEQSGGRVMLGYRAYIFGPDGHIKNRVEFFADDEDDAKEQAERLVDGHAVELWLEARMIARFEPHH
jgi:hypothetical protein